MTITNEQRNLDALSIVALLAVGIPMSMCIGALIVLTFKVIGLHVLWGVVPFTVALVLVMWRGFNDE